MNPLLKRTLVSLWRLSPGRSRLVWHGRRKGDALALTFDDGPTPNFTPRILDQLAVHQARATFFLEGARVEQHPDLVHRIVEAGHEIGNHGYRHDATPLPVQASLCEAALGSLGLQTHWFRPPRGELTLADALRLWARRYRIALWSVDARDSMRHEGKWPHPGPDYQTLRPGDIVLFHDDNPVAIEDLTTALSVLRPRGWRTVTLSQLQI